jgi:RHS repeat-associated protein
MFCAAKSKTRVWASDLAAPRNIGQSGPLSSTSHWGWTFCSYEIASERLVGKYFPYGQERPSATTDGKEKFATYFRDSETGLDYANSRYHQPGMGRFMSPDLMNGNPKDPESLNKYAYAGGDPINHADPSGNAWICVDQHGDGPDLYYDDGTPDNISEFCYGTNAPFYMMLNPILYNQTCGDSQREVLAVASLVSRPRGSPI